MKIKRADIERILILCAAALVVVLALRSGGQTTSQVLVETAEVPVEQTHARPRRGTRFPPWCTTRTGTAIWCP